MTTITAQVAATDITAVEDLCARWETAWNDHDGEAVAALCADDLVYDEPALGDTAHGPDSIRNFVHHMAALFPDYSFTRMGLYGEVTRRAVLVAWRFSGTLAGTDQRVEFHGDDRLELGEDGLIQAYRCLYDYKSVLAQIEAPVGVGPGVNETTRPRKPASERRAEIMAAADAEFAANGLAGTRLEAIAARVGVSHPRIVQMFGSKRVLFLKVVHAAFDRIDAAFVQAEPTLVGLGDAYRRLLQSERTVGLVMLQAYAAAADEAVREEVRRRQLQLQESIARLTGADGLQVRTFFATGLIMTVSELLELPEQRADTAWSAWILERAAPPGGD